MVNRTRVFISYTHDSEPHVQFVLELAERLIEDGFNVILDIYLDDAPLEGWQQWLENELAAADYTLIINTPTYLKRYQQNQLIDNQAPEFNGLVITEPLYQQFKDSTKFIPILPADVTLASVIPPLQGQNNFELMADYLGLHQLLKNRKPQEPKGTPEAAKWENSNEQTYASQAPRQTTPIATEPDQPKASPAIPSVYIAAIVLGVILLAVILMLAF